MTTEEVQGIAVITVSRSVIDVTNSEQFAMDLAEATRDAERFVIDLSNVQFIDSSGLGKIVTVVRKTKDARRSLAICCARPAVTVLFNMVKLHQIVQIFPGRDEAITHLSGS